METQLHKMEELIEQSLDRITCHPAFLTAVSNVINLNSYRKIWIRKALEAIWKDLELPIKGDQERILLALQEMQIRIKKMQLELQEKEKKKPLRRTEPK
jgi:CO dehydrogenase/acetyl-CoA synthase beta subunit